MTVERWLEAAVADATWRRFRLLSSLTERAGSVVWNSPLTTTIHVPTTHPPTADRQPIVY